MKKKILPILIILFILLLIVLAMFIYKYNLLIKIGTEHNNFIESNNFYFEVISNNEKEKNDSKYNKQLYVKDNKSLRCSLADNNVVYQFYIDANNKTMVIVNNLEKQYNIVDMSTIVGNKALSNLPQIITESTSIQAGEFDFKTLLITLLSTNISTEKDNNSEYLKISFNQKENSYTETVWLNKATLLPVKAEINGNMRSYTFEKDVVTDNDVTFSNTNNYELLVNP